MATLSDLKRLLIRKGQIKSKLTDIETFVEQFVANSNPKEIENRIGEMYKIREEFDNANIDILMCCETSTDEQGISNAKESEDEISKNRVFTKQWYTALSNLQTLLEESAPQAPSTPIVSNPNVQFPLAAPQFNVRLPVINLPVFTGVLTEWLPFYDAFQSLIHNNQSLDECQRFHYLKSCVKGEASRAIESLSISSENYQSAWAVLQKRYKNTRLIIQGHVQSILNSPEIGKCSADSLQKLIDDVSNNLEALRVLKIPVDTWDAILVTVIMNKLDYHTRREFENTLNSDPLTLPQVTDFLEKKRVVLESLNQNSKQKLHDKSSHYHGNLNAPHKTQKAHADRISNAATSKFACYYCKGSHFISHCEEFLGLNVKERKNEVGKRNLCLNCLKANHKLTECKSTGCCQTCKSRHHHTLIHEDKPVILQQPHSSSANHCTAFPKTQVVLSTAIVSVKDSRGKYRECRSLLDVGSQINILSESMCNLLHLKTSESDISISGINNSCSNTVKTAKITLRSLHHPYETSVECCILQNVTANLPSESFSKAMLSIPENVKLADPRFNETGPIDLLLGAETFWSLLCLGRIKLSKPNLYLSKTLLGWIVGGAFTDGDQNATISCNVALQKGQPNELNDLLERFWVQEEVEPTQNNWTAEEIECEEHFVNTYRRDSNDGRFIVELPFKTNKVSLGDSSQNARRRFIALERKFRKNNDFQELYCKAIRELLQNGYLEEVSPEEIEDKRVYYLPHSGVTKYDPIKPKLRVVYDGSAKSSNGLSLNDNLMTGPNLQNDPFGILIRSRTHQVVLSCDMEKMFLQIIVDPKNTDYQLIYWRFNENEPIKTFRLTRLVFGLTNSPYTAIRCVKQLASDVKDEFPTASRVLIEDRFTDDILTGSGTVQDGMVLREQLVEVLGRGGFRLAKWNTNVPEILSETGNISGMVDLNKGESAKVLGLWWDPSQDTLNYRIQTQAMTTNLTKRLILSSIAKIYDPIGIISPVLIKAKMLMQNLWSLNLDWDDPVPQHIGDEWSQYTKELEYLNQMKIPRKVIPKAEAETDLIVFCDASLRAYGAVVYLRTKIEDNNYAVNLVCSKSRVSPLKVLSLPRLELCGALLGAKLADQVSRYLNIAIQKKYYFTDSMIVLHYLNANANTWQVFVANRVAKIQNLSNIDDWQHVESKGNPADLISRGAYPRQTDSKFYWEGPSFLTEDVSEWPESRFRCTKEFDSIAEKRKTVLVARVVTEFPVITKYSSFQKLQRVTAYCLRFIYNVQNRNQKRLGTLTTEELIASHHAVMRIIQTNEFLEERVSLERHQSVARSSRLYSLDPFIDQDGLIRLGGRLRNSSLSFDMKFPIVLPTKHHVTRLLIKQEHAALLHAGATQTLASLRTRYWPLRAKNEVRKVIHSCVSCFRVSPRLTEQKMGDLPVDRLTPCRPFLKVGLDYFGPIYLKQGGKRSTKIIKAWVALFVCLVTKAIHLEVVSDLTTDCFINALKRFCSRRGKISHLYCDNAKTFVGAKAKLDEISKFLNNQNFEVAVQPYLLQENITWKFIPPRSPNFGGLWERLVRSAKQHLKRVVGKANLTIEEAITLMTQIEAIVNSRPLTAMSNDPSDLQVLTPAHFLIGESLSAPPEHNVIEIPENRLSRWERLQKIKQHFWKRWNHEVLTQLQPKPKWCQAMPSLQVGTLVLVAEDNSPPMCWKIGRIEKVFPGPDGLIRVATVRTNQGTYTRSIRKLAVLPTNEV